MESHVGDATAGLADNRLTGTQLSRELRSWACHDRRAGFRLLIEEVEDPLADVGQGPRIHLAGVADHSLSRDGAHLLGHRP